MTPNISITLNTPHVTIERYSELTGLSIDTINDMLADGRLPRHRLRKDKKREKVMITAPFYLTGCRWSCRTFRPPPPCRPSSYGTEL